MILVWTFFPIEKDFFVLMNECSNILLFIVFHLEDKYDFIIGFLEDVFNCWLLDSFRLAFVVADTKFLHFLCWFFSLLLLIVLFGRLLSYISLLCNLILFVYLLNKFRLLLLYTLLRIEHLVWYIWLREIQYFILPNLALHYFPLVFFPLFSDQGRSWLLGVIINWLVDWNNNPQSLLFFIIFSFCQSGLKLILDLKLFELQVNEIFFSNLQDYLLLIDL